MPDQSAGLNDLALGPDGNLWFTETNAATDGTYHLRSISSAGAFGPAVSVPVGEYDNSDEGPSDLVSSGGSLWFRSSLGDVIDRYVSGGSLTTVFGSPDVPDGDYTTSLGPSDQGGVWATDFDGGEQPGGTNSDLRLFPASAGAATTPAVRSRHLLRHLFPDPAGARLRWQRLVHRRRRLPAHDQ